MKEIIICQGFLFVFRSHLSRCLFWILRWHLPQRIYNCRLEWSFKWGKLSPFAFWQDFFSPTCYPSNSRVLCTLFSFVARPYPFFNWSFKGWARTANMAFVKIFGRFVTWDFSSPYEEESSFSRYLIGSLTFLIDCEIFCWNPENLVDRHGFLS